MPVLNTSTSRFKYTFMKHQQLHQLSRVLLLVCAVLLGMVLFQPIWQIDLDAPQYPEGLSLLIHANGIRGNVDIINGLNHYIGMKTLHSTDFIEFTLLPYIVVAYALAFLIAAWHGRIRTLRIVLFAFILFGIIAMVDFWRWEYNYGHHLDPNAAIIVPGMAYQPPLIGFKQLLNFGAYSFPAIGGWFFIAAGFIALLILIIESKRLKKMRVNPSAIILLLLPFLLQSCTTKPEPIKAGTDACANCKMTITDLRFSAEVLTKKGRVYKFDDLKCVIQHLKSHPGLSNETSGIYTALYTEPQRFVPVEQAVLLQSDGLHSPMNGNVAAFESAMALKKEQNEKGGAPVKWNDLQP